MELFQQKKFFKYKWKKLFASKEGFISLDFSLNDFVSVHDFKSLLSLGSETNWTEEQFLTKGVNNTQCETCTFDGEKKTNFSRTIFPVVLFKRIFILIPKTKSNGV